MQESVRNFAECHPESRGIYAKVNYLRSYKIPTSAELEKGTSVKNGSESEIQAHDRFVRTGSAATPPQLPRAKPLPAHGERMVITTGRQLRPLSSVLYGIILRRRSVLAAQLLLREKSGA